MTDRIEAGAKALFEFSRGYHPELTFDRITPEHRDYLMRAAEAVLNGAEAYQSLGDRGLSPLSADVQAEAD